MFSNISLSANLYIKSGRIDVIVEAAVDFWAASLLPSEYQNGWMSTQIAKVYCEVLPWY